MSFCSFMALVIIDPYKFTPLTRKLALFNEFTLLIVADGLFMFSDLVSNPSAKYQAGWYLIITVALNLIVNCFAITFAYSK